jgi:heterodisulfide reductase subunit B
MKKFAFFLGCITPLRYPGIEAATRLVMKEFGIELVDMQGASCCPAPGVFGSFDLWNWLLVGARNLSIAEQLNADLTLTCNGCYATLQETNHLLKDEDKLKKVNEILRKTKRSYSGNTKVRHCVELLAEDIGLEKIKSKITKPLKGLKVGVHYGCHYLKPSKVRMHENPEAPDHLDKIVETLGAESVPYREKLMCCGAGGGVRAGNIDEALDFTLEKVQNMKDAGVDCVLTPCAFCHYQFDTGQIELKKKGKWKTPIPTIFVTQLVGLAMGISPEDLGLYDHHVPPSYTDKLGLKSGKAKKPTSPTDEAIASC